MSAEEKHEFISNLLKQHGIAEHVVVFSESTKTSQDAANQIGCPIARIAKDIVFKAGDNVVCVLASGANRVSLDKLHQLVGMPIEKADAAFVLEKTGFPIGGVPPFGHVTQTPYAFIDKDLMQFQTVWCAGGTPHSVFEIPTQKLVEITKAKTADIKE